MSWKLAGDYFENCSCEILCPCITSSLQGPASYDRCQVPIVCRIDDGYLDDVRLDGLCFAMVVDSPAVMASGGWRVAVYLDERADEAQQHALGTILSGELGGPPAALAPLIGEQLGVKLVPFRYEEEPNRRRVEVPGIMELEVEGILSPANGKVLEITNTVHPMGEDLPIARGVKGVFHDPDYGLEFDNTGKNGHFRPFSWQG